MVDGVSRINSTGITTKVDGGRTKIDSTSKKVVFDPKNPTPPAKGISVESGNPYFKKIPNDYFMELKSSERDEARKETNNVRTRLAMAYAEVIRENPNALDDVELPLFPEVPTDCKKKDRLKTYLDELKNHEFMVTTLLNDAKKATIVEQVNANTDMRTAQTQAIVVATSNAELGAIYGLHVDMLNGLNGIASMIDSSTHRIITAVNANGEKVVRAIDKATGEIKEYIAKDGNLTRIQEFLNSVGLHDHMEYTRRHLGYKIDDQGQWTRQHVTGEHMRTRAHIDFARLWAPPMSTPSSVIPSYAPDIEFESFDTPVDYSYPDPSLLFLNAEFAEGASDGASSVPNNGKSDVDSSTADIPPADTPIESKKEVEKNKYNSAEK